MTEFKHLKVIPIKMERYKLGTSLRVIRDLRAEFSTLPKNSPR